MHDRGSATRCTTSSPRRWSPAPARERQRDDRRCAASGESSTLHSATTMAPPRFAASTVASRSGLAPDCEIARHTTVAQIRLARRRASSRTARPTRSSTPSAVSIRYLRERRCVVRTAARASHDGARVHVAQQSVRRSRRIAPRLRSSCARTPAAAPAPPRRYIVRDAAGITRRRSARRRSRRCRRDSRIARTRPRGRP